MRLFIVGLFLLVLLAPWVLNLGPTRGVRDGRPVLLLIEGGEVDLRAFEALLGKGRYPNLDRLSSEGCRLALWRSAPPLEILGKAAVAVDAKQRLRSVPGAVNALQNLGWKVRHSRSFVSDTRVTPLPGLDGVDLVYHQISGSKLLDTNAWASHLESLVKPWISSVDDSLGILILSRGWDGVSRRQVAVGLCWGSSFQRGGERYSIGWDGLGGMLLFLSGHREEALKTQFVPMEALAKGYVFHHEL